MRWALHEVGGGSRISDTPPPTNPSRKEKELEARRAPSSCHPPSLRGTPPPFPQPGWAAAKARVQPGNRGGKEVLADPLGLGEWPSHAEPPPWEGLCLLPGKGGARARALEPPGRPARVGCRGPRGPGAGFVCRGSSLGRRQPGYKMAGKGWDRRRSPRGSAPLCLQCSRGRGRRRRRHCEPPALAPATECDPPPVTPRPSGPAASVWRLHPPPYSAEPRPRQLQKMAAKAAPVATLPRAGGGLRGRPAAPLPSASRDSPPGRPDPRGHRGIWGRSGGREGRGRGGYLPEEGAGGGGWQGASARRALSVLTPPPNSACPVPSRGRGARVGQC